MVTDQIRNFHSEAAINCYDSAIGHKYAPLKINLKKDANTHLKNLLNIKREITFFQ